MSVFGTDAESNVWWILSRTYVTLNIHNINCYITFYSIYIYFF